MSTKYIRFKELCLENGNPEAHYIVQYFVHKEKQTGLFHLRQSAAWNNGNGMHLYVLLMLAEGHYQTGKNIWINSNGKRNDQPPIIAVKESRTH